MGELVPESNSRTLVQQYRENVITRFQFSRVLLKFALDGIDLDNIMQMTGMEERDQAILLIEEAAKAELEFYQAKSTADAIVRLNNYLGILEAKLNGQGAIAAINTALRVLEFRDSLLAKNGYAGSVGDSGVNIVIDGIVLEDLR